MTSFEPSSWVCSHQHSINQTGLSPKTTSGKSRIWIQLTKIRLIFLIFKERFSYVGKRCRFLEENNEFLRNPTPHQSVGGWATDNSLLMGATPVANPRGKPTKNAGVWQPFGPMDWNKNCSSGFSWSLPDWFRGGGVSWKDCVSYCLSFRNLGFTRSVEIWMKPLFRPPPPKFSESRQTVYTCWISAQQVLLDQNSPPIISWYGENIPIICKLLPPPCRRFRNVFGGGKNRMNLGVLTSKPVPLPWGILILMVYLPTWMPSTQ